MADSSSDSEFFESADEGIDNDNDNQSLKKIHYVGQTIPTDSTFSTSSAANESEMAQDFKEHSVQYRKRPERGKIIPNPEGSKDRKTTSIKDQILKSDIIKPDALIQDITSNLSKNLNKGFSTITQTSTSIKDLVVNSLPLATQKGQLGKFSYDDDDEEDVVPEISDVMNDMINEPDTEEVTKIKSNEDLECKKSADIGDNKLFTTGNDKSFVFQSRTNDSDTCSEIDLFKIPHVSSLPPKNQEIESIDNSEDTMIHEDLEIQFETSDIFLKGKSKTDIGKKCDVETLEGESFKDKNFKSDLQEIDNKSEDTFNDNNKLEFTSDEIVADGLLNEKDAWDSSDIDLNELNIEENLSDAGTESKTSECRNISKRIEDNNQLSDNNEGWDDFDIDDSEINLMHEEVARTGYNNSECVENKNNESVNEENINKNINSDARWTGWEHFGEKQETKKSSWGLGGWGVNALLNTATSVTQGLSNVLEAGLGAPDPETLARMELEARKVDKGRPQERRIVQEKEKENSSNSKQDSNNSGLNLFPTFGLTNLVAGVTKNIVENTKVHEIGSKVISGGLDTLESFGKKTMEVLQEGDPGLKKKRALLLGSDKPILSQILREAKTKAEIEDRKMEERQMAKMCHFETLFDDFQGLVHLEALEMLSRQCELKIEQMTLSLPKNEVEDLLGILDEVKELCIIDEEDFKLNYSLFSMVDFKISLNNAVEPMKNEISIQKILQVYDEFETLLKSDGITNSSPQMICQKAMSTLAELTAATVQQFHKAGELLSIKEHRKTVEEADALLQLTGYLCCEINQISEKFLKLLTSHVTEADMLMAKKIKEEAVNATSYIKDAFNLLIPVLQLGAAT